MTETMIRTVGRPMVIDDNVIPDSNNRLICLNCTKENCKGGCELISRNKGKVKNKIRYVR